MAIVGAVDKLDTFMVQGWAWNTDSDKPVHIDVRIGDVTIKRLRAVLSDRAFNGAVQNNLVGFRFFFTDELLSYVGKDQPISFTVDGVPLHVRKVRLRHNPDPRPLEELRSHFRDGGIISKKGEIIKSIHLDTEWQAHAFDLYDHARATMQRLFGMDLYVVYGTLLGMVRDNGFIAGDDDFDTSYLSSCTNLADVRRELVKVAATLVAAGEEVEVMEGQALLKWKRKDGRLIDVFPSWIENANYYLVFGVGGPIAADIRRGFEEVAFLGRKVLAPVARETLLAWTYGPGWRVPDPAFQWVIPRNIRKIMSAMVPDAAERAQVYWSRKYRGAGAAAEPSGFAQYVAANWVDDTIKSVIDVGCGDGRDTAFVAGAKPALGLDYSASGIRRNMEAWADNPNLRFSQADVRDPEACVAIARGAAEAAPGPILLYSRFFLHAIDDAAEAGFRQFVRSALPPRSILALEFRTDRDATQEKTFADHYRRFVNPKDFIARMESTGGFTLLHEEAGHGLAVYGTEDPHVARLVFRRVARLQPFPPQQRSALRTARKGLAILRRAMGLASTGRARPPSRSPQAPR